MAQPNYDDIDVGDQPVRLETDPISRTTLALYGGASGDHNPMHIDIDYARAAGETDVFAHGMLVMAYLGRAVTSWVPQSRAAELQYALYGDHPSRRKNRGDRQGRREDCSQGAINWCVSNSPPRMIRESREALARQSSRSPDPVCAGHEGTGARQVAWPP